MISDHEFSLGRGCPTKVAHARARLPRADSGDGMAAWMRAENGKVRALARHLFPGAIRVGDADSAAEETRQLLASGTPVMRAKFITGELSGEVDFVVPDNAAKILRVYQVAARPVDLEQYRRRLVFTQTSGKIYADWRHQLELLAFRLEVIRTLWPEHRVLPFFVVPVKGRTTAVEGLHGFFQEAADGWTCTHPDAGVEAHRLLVTLGVSEECRAVAGDVRRHLETLRQWLREPTAPRIGYSCRKCPFKVDSADSGFDRCWGTLAKVTPHMFDLAYLYFVMEQGKPVADRLAREGRVSLWDVPTELIQGQHADRQFLQLEGMQTGRVIMDQELRQEMSQVEYPLHFLDIETTEAILPPHRGALVGALHLFQLSVHRLEHADAPLQHADWLHTERNAPNRRFLSELRAKVGDRGTVLTWSDHERKSFQALLAQLIDQGAEGDDLCWLRQFLAGPRLVDMHAMAYRHVWYPGMAGRTSLKWVLPAVWAHASELRVRPPYSSYPAHIDPYAALEEAGQVSEGCGAMGAYLEMQSSEGERRERLIRELREYNGIDTLAAAFCWQAWELELKRREGAACDPGPAADPVASAAFPSAFPSEFAPEPLVAIAGGRP